MKKLLVIGLLLALVGAQAVEYVPKDLNIEVPPQSKMKLNPQCVDGRVIAFIQFKHIGGAVTRLTKPMFITDGKKDYPMCCKLKKKGAYSA